MRWTVVLVNSLPDFYNFTLTLRVVSEVPGALFTKAFRLNIGVLPAGFLIATLCGGGGGGP